MLATTSEPLPRSNAESAAAPPQIDWQALVQKVQSGSQDGMEELYRVFLRGVRFYLCRQLGPQELEDKVHDTFIIVVQAINRGDLREPERLPGFVRTIVRRQVAAHIDAAVHTRREQADIDSGLTVKDAHENPEQRILIEERVAVARRILESMSEKDREVLTRFYMREQSQEQICSEMQLTETQFRLLKSRAKARFGELGKKAMQKRGRLPQFWVRNLAVISH